LIYGGRFYGKTEKTENSLISGWWAGEKTPSKEGEKIIFWNIPAIPI